MKIALLGDIALIGKYDLSKNPEAVRRLDVVKEYLDQFDYVICNLESPLTDVTKTWIPKSMHLRSPRKNIEILKYLGVDVVSIANNHTYDFGKTGFAETIETLEQNGIEWCGAYGKDVQIRQNGESINVSGFCCASTNGIHLGCANIGKNTIHLLNRFNVERQLQKDDEQKAFSLIVSHWGQEHTSYPGKDTVKIARKIAGMKSNLAIVAHHPHQIQGIEKYNGNLIAYSLGNFLFDDCVSINGRMHLRQTEANKRTFILSLDIKDGSLANYSTQGFLDDDSLGLVKFDNDKEMEEFSSKIYDFESVEYEQLRKKQIAGAQQKKFGKRDLKWILSRFNYYAVGAKLLTYFNSKQYKVCVNDFCGDL
jgi:poly-gamma-glutamate synthesis protein (capsule biosynthesis protein)